MMSFIERDCPICEKSIQAKEGIIPDINPDNILNSNFPGKIYKYININFLIIKYNPFLIISN